MNRRDFLHRLLTRRGRGDAEKSLSAPVAVPIGTRPARSGPHRLKLVGILGRYTNTDSRSRRQTASPFAGKRLVLGRLVPGRRLGMDAQSTHAWPLRTRFKAL